MESFVAAAEILKERGAYKIFVMATHGLLSADAPRLIEESSIDEVGLLSTLQSGGWHQNSQITHLISCFQLVGSSLEQNKTKKKKKCLRLILAHIRSASLVYFLPKKNISHPCLETSLPAAGALWCHLTVQPLSPR